MRVFSLLATTQAISSMTPLLAVPFWYPFLILPLAALIRAVIRGADQRIGRIDLSPHAWAAILIVVAFLLFRENKVLSAALAAIGLLIHMCANMVAAKRGKPQVHWREHIRLKPDIPSPDQLEASADSIESQMESR